MSNKTQKSSNNNFDLDKAREIIRKGQKELMQILIITAEDCDLLWENIKEEPKNQSWRRLYVRSVYTYFESQIFIIKFIAFLYQDLPSKETKTLSRAEEAIILEHSYHLTRSGETRIRKNFQEAAKNLRFAFKVYAKVWNLDFKLNTNSKGWQSYLKGLEIRNRLTHPKKISDLNISDDELKITNNALKWNLKNLKQLYAESILKDENTDKKVH